MSKTGRYTLDGNRRLGRLDKGTVVPTVDHERQQTTPHPALPYPHPPRPPKWVKALRWSQHLQQFARGIAAKTTSRPVHWDVAALQRVIGFRVCRDGAGTWQHCSAW